VTNQAFWVAQICETGHIVSPKIENYPGAEETYCSKCGSRTLKECPNCNAAIRGASRYRQTVPATGALAGAGPEYTRPAFCSDCSKPYPWTEAAIAAANELAQMELQKADLDGLANIIENLVRDTPQTAVAATRFRLLMAKVKPPVAEAFKAILINVVTEAAKRLIYPGP
jgi:hypothetical protein